MFFVVFARIWGCRFRPGCIDKCVSTLTTPVTHPYRLTCPVHGRNSSDFLIFFAAFINYYFVDQEFNGMDWQRAFQEAMQLSYTASSAETVHRETSALVARLGDPYTKVLPLLSGRIFQAESNGKVRTYYSHFAWFALIVKA